MADSIAIQRIIRRAEGEGNAIMSVSSGWSRIREMTHMVADVSEDLWIALQRDEPQLRSWTSDATPHNRAERGFTDEGVSEAVSFPR
ncbi:hypothetical protein N6H05_15455 [Sphingobium sp. WTD-1]|uniref:hypothetical protein n=1 Tax=Sphingobium sp. WTD-1 TaxID=2979467 RepID=UPI0024DEB575|nr:hypothetical protein [Sphingobium sp. WTD-1]WIA54456.1 hypothetical protein N6H05_15455 [Sphingobium sp. WTD-1]